MYFFTAGWTGAVGVLFHSWVNWDSGCCIFSQLSELGQWMLYFFTAEWTGAAGVLFHSLVSELGQRTYFFAAEWTGAADVLFFFTAKWTRAAGVPYHSWENWGNLFTAEWTGGADVLFLSWANWGSRCTFLQPSELGQQMYLITAERTGVTFSQLSELGQLLYLFTAEWTGAVDVLFHSWENCSSGCTCSQRSEFGDRMYLLIRMVHRILGVADILLWPSPPKLADVCGSQDFGCCRHFTLTLTTQTCGCVWFAGFWVLQTFYFDPHHPNLRMCVVHSIVHVADILLWPLPPAFADVHG